MLALSLALTASAADDGAAIRNTFVPAYVNALRSHDAVKIERFLHPRVLACRSAQNKDYFGRVLTAESGLDLTGNYQITKIDPWNKPMPLLGLPEDGFLVPVQPAYEVQISLAEGHTDVIRFLAPTHGSWYVVYPCPNTKGMAFLHERMMQKEQQRQQVVKRASELRDPLLAELKALLKQGQIISAVKRYQSATNADLTTAKMVIDTLRN